MCGAGLIELFIPWMRRVLVLGSRALLCRISFVRLPHRKDQVMYQTREGITFARLVRLLASPLVWIGTGGLIACVAILCAGGDLGPIPFALRFGEAFKTWFPRLFAWLFWGSVALAVAGVLLGVLRCGRPTPAARAAAAEAEVARLQEEIARLKGGNPDHENTGNLQ